MQPDPSSMVDEILSGIDDQLAVRVLFLLIEDRSMQLDGLSERDAITAVRGALDQADVQSYVDADQVSDHDLALCAIYYLWSSGSVSQDLIAEAVKAARSTSRADPITIGLVGLVLAAMQTEIKISKDQGGGWKFSLHKHPMKDSALGKLLSALLTKLG